jgi:hypothetical protein
MPKKKSRYFADAILLGMIITAIYIGTVVLDIRLPDPENTIPIIVDYHIGSSNLDPLALADIHIEANLTFTGTLVVGKEATLNANAFAGTPLGQSFTSGAVLIHGSMPYALKEDNNNGQPIFNTVLLHKDSSGKLVGDSVKIYFVASGEYPLAFSFENSTTTLDFHESAMSMVSVEPASELQTEKFNRINIGIAFALIYFAFIEGFKTYLEYRK